MVNRSYFLRMSSPYYVWAPRYNETSAGVVVLHLLCHSLNVSGQEAYLIIESSLRVDECVKKGLLTPILTRKILLQHQREKRQPVIIYPEVVMGNPLGASKIVRYYLNKPGFFTGAKHLNLNEFNLAYTSSMLNGYQEADHILYLPLINTNLFCVPERPEKRVSGKVCYYLGRNRDAKRTSVLIKPDSVEITLKYPANKIELVKIFQECEYFISYQDSGLCLEATLCGCIAIILPNKDTESPLSEKETMMYGIAWGDSPGEIARAQATLGLVRNLYINRIDEFWVSLDLFIEKSQEIHCGEDVIIDVSSYFGINRFFYRVKKKLLKLSKKAICSS